MQFSDDDIYWLALNQIPGVGPMKLHRKWEEISDILQIWQELSAGVIDAESLLDSAKSALVKTEQHEVSVLTLSNPKYPQSLRSIPEMPPILYVKGDLLDQDLHAVSIVGTRTPSRYGIEVTQKLTGQLVENGFTIVSGMARGIDAIAHQAAMEAGGRTLAVWGSGLDCAYPAEHSRLADQILKHGAIISSFPLGTRAQSFTFPERNKIIAGLSEAIIVTEAMAKSGSLLTAEAGIKYGRKVGAVPGSVFQRGTAGTHQLIQHGAQLVVDAADIVDTKVSSKTPKYLTHPYITSVSVPEQTLLNQLQSGPQHVDELIRNAAQPAAEVVSTLALLEIKGSVKQLAPGEYIKLD